MKEFGLIERYFTWKTDDVSIAQGVGDDCALIDIDSNARIVTTVDTSIEDVHFAKNTPARAIAHKALAVNLSDLAAMGLQSRLQATAVRGSVCDAAVLRERGRSG